MIQWRPKLGGKNKLVGWLNSLLANTRQGTIKAVIGGGRLLPATDGATLVIDPASGGSGGINPRGEYDSTKQYKARDLVFISTGAAMGTYLCSLTPPIGTSPDTGAPSWVSFPSPSPGVWA